MTPGISQLINSIENEVFKTECGHTFHNSCLEERMMRGWKPRKRITFDFLECPVCFQQMNLRGDSLAASLSKQHESVFKKVLLVSLKAIRTEKLEKCDALTQEDSPFKGKMQQFALAVFVCYECDKC